MNKTRTSVLKTLLATVGLVFMLSVQPVAAQIPTTTSITETVGSTTTTKTGLTNPSGWLTIVPKDCQTGDGCDICEVSKVFTNAADLIAGAVSAVALVMFIIGGLFWIFSGGVESRVETGKKILIGTVTGLGLVFVAWFGVNVIVRTAALSGGKATSTIFTSGTFNKEWWSFEGCYPDLPTTCKGLNIGAACAASPCSSGYKNPNCSCYRAIDLTGGGDTSTCNSDADATSITDANSTTKKCMCADGCEQFSATTAGKDYVCTTTASTSEATHEINTSLVCKDSTKVCAKPK